FRYLVKPIDGEDLLRHVRTATSLGRMARVRREALAGLGTLNRQISDRMGLEVKFASALSRVWMAFQPIVRLSTREVYAYEALVRSDEPTLPHPGALFDAAERLDRVAELGRVIRTRTAEAFAAAPSGIRLF